MKTILATAVFLSAATPALAGPYVNIESNSNRVGNQYLGTVIEKHVGYENTIGNSGSYYIQAGPAVLSTVDSAEVEFSGKAGAAYQINEKASVYGEYAFISGYEVGSAVKAGVKYNF